MSRAALIAASIVVAASATATGCTLVADYPPARRETCSDGRDDDLDGLLDCDDPDCDGRCSEDTEARCSDARDNDGDGRRDAEDVRCWPFAQAVVERCESVGPASWTGTFEAGREGWVGDDLVIVADPRDPEARVGRLRGTLDRPTFAVGPVLAGAHVGSETRFELEVDGASRYTAVGLLVEGADTRTLVPDGLFVYFAGADVGLSGSSQIVPIAPTATERRWVTGALRVVRDDDGEAAIELEIGGAVIGPDALAAQPFWFPGANAGGVPRAWSEGRAMRPMVVTTGEVHIGRVDVELVRLDPCAVDGGDARVPQIEGTVLGLASSRGVTCAIVAEPAGPDDDAAHLVSRRSLDGGRTFDGASELARSVEDSVDIGPLVATEDGFHAVLPWHRTRPAEDASAAITHVDLARSADCTSWTVEPLGLDLFPSLFSKGMGYAADASGHELTFVLYTPRGLFTARLLRARSPTGLPGTFAWLDGDTAIPAEIVFFEGIGGVLPFRLGDDRALVFASDRGIDAMIETTPGTWTALAEPLVTPSGRVGTFDQLLVSSPALAFDAPAPASEPPRGGALVAFTGGTACATGRCTTRAAVARLDLRIE
ncbi:MAG: hypothetical protein IT379_42300 [Deltaproteobacteria bacterium]|nr:hypothetical protein [Deltaproteobacteria bacterium]